MVIFSQITEKQCVKDQHSALDIESSIAQDCAAVLAIIDS